MNPSISTLLSQSARFISSIEVNGLQKYGYISRSGSTSTCPIVSFFLALTGTVSSQNERVISPLLGIIYVNSLPIVSFKIKSESSHSVSGPVRLCTHIIYKLPVTSSLYLDTCLVLSSLFICLSRRELRCRVLQPICLSCLFWGVSLQGSIFCTLHDSSLYCTLKEHG